MRVVDVLKLAHTNVKGHFGADGNDGFDGEVWFWGGSGGELCVERVRTESFRICGREDGR